MTFIIKTLAASSSSLQSGIDLCLLSQWKEFLLFACLLLAVCIIFSIMGCFYTYVDPEQLDKVYLQDSGREEDDVKKTKDVHMKEAVKNTRL